MVKSREYRPIESFSQLTPLGMVREVCEIIQLKEGSYSFEKLTHELYALVCLSIVRTISHIVRSSSSRQ